MVISNLIALICIAVAIGTTASTRLIQKPAEQPTVIQAVAPVFSNYQVVIPEAHRSVVISVKIDNAGNVISAENVSGIDVNAKAKQAAMRWKFSATEKSKAERVANLKFNFRLMPLEATKEDLTSVFRPPFEIEVRRRIELLQK